MKPIVIESAALRTLIDTRSCLLKHLILRVVEDRPMPLAIRVQDYCEISTPGKDSLKKAHYSGKMPSTILENPYGARSS